SSTVVRMSKCSPSIPIVYSVRSSYLQREKAYKTSPSGRAASPTPAQQDNRRSKEPKERIMR
uniref:Uncharacterized protein n=1 Tax=Aegilops tauschii subsp. strangulata TaxID=200361 RepID=A0A453R7H7_AEGTS